MNKPTIRSAQTEDLEQIAELTLYNWQSSYRDLLPGDFLEELTVPKIREIWSAFLKAENSRIFLAENGERILGFAACREDSELDDTWYLDSLQVREETRGQGLGTALIRKVGASALEKGYGAMTICIVKGNDRAGELYRRLGARHYKDFTDDFHGTTTNSEKLIWTDLTIFENQ